MAFDALPQAKAPQRLGRRLGQRDLAPVEGRLGHGCLRLLLHDADGQAVTRQRLRQAQPGGAGAADEKVEVHGRRG